MRSFPILVIPSLQKKFDFLIELVLVSILIISPLLYGSVAPFPVLLMEISAFLILFLWILKCIKQNFCDFTQLSINKPIFFFLLFILVQYFLINFFIPSFPLGAVYKQKMRTEIFKLVSYLILFYTVLNNFQKRAKINRLVYVLMAIGFLLSFFGIIRKLALPDFLSSFASFPNRNHFANYVNMIIFLSLGGVFSCLPFLRNCTKDFSKENIIKGISITFQKGIWLYMFSLIIMSSAVFYSLSRGGIISFFCGLIFFSFLILTKGLTKRGYVFLFIILISMLAVLVWVKAPKDIIRRFSAHEEGNKTVLEKMLGDRKVFVDSGIEFAKRYPICGVGLGAFPFIYNDKHLPIIFMTEGKPHFYIDHLHNDFLELFCEVGFIGFTIFFIAVCLYFFFVLKVFRKRHDSFVIGLGAGAMASLFSMCVHSFFDFSLHITSNAILFFTISGLVLVITNSQIREKKEMTLLPKKRIFGIKNLYIRILLVFFLSVTFFYISKSMVSQYIAYKTSREGEGTIGSLKRAVNLDPLNDRYHFLLAEVFIKKARADAGHSQQYINCASKEIKEAIKLNPWDKYYHEYLTWILGTFSPSIKGEN